MFRILRLIITGKYCNHNMRHHGLWHFRDRHTEYTVHIWKCTKCGEQEPIKLEDPSTPFWLADERLKEKGLLK